MNTLYKSFIRQAKLYEVMNIKPPKYIKLLVDIKNKHTFDTHILDSNATYISIYYKKKLYFRIVYMKRTNDLILVNENKEYIDIMTKHFPKFGTYNTFTERYIFEYLEYDKIKR